MELKNYLLFLHPISYRENRLSRLWIGEVSEKMEQEIKNEWAP